MRIFFTFYNKFRNYSERRLNYPFWGYVERLIRPVEAVVLRMLKFNIIDCYGDSHSKIFRHANELSIHYHIYFRVISVRGATSFGLANPNSKTNAFSTFKKWICRSGRKKILFMIGEVDCGFLIWLKAAREGRNPYDIMHEALINYQNFISAQKDNVEDIIVCSAPLPTIQDEDMKGIVANLRKDVKANQIERTVITIEFNNQMDYWCRSNHILFINLDKMCLDADTKLVKSELLNKNPFDHHYDPTNFKKIILQGFRDSEAFQMNCK